MSFCTYIPLIDRLASPQQFLEKIHPLLDRQTFHFTVSLALVPGQRRFPDNSIHIVTKAVCDPPGKPAVSVKSGAR